MIDGCSFNEAILLHSTPN